MSSTFLRSLLVACLAFLPAAASAEFRGQYELVLSGADGTTSIRSASDHRDGESIVHELGEHTVTLQPTFSEDGTYELQVPSSRSISALWSIVAWMVWRIHMSSSTHC